MGKQEDWKKALKADPTDWLLEEENLVVHYWALRDLTDASQEEVEEARVKALTSEVVEEVFQQQKPEGHWENPDNMHAPHYTSTIYQLALLSDLGVKADDQRVVRGVEAVLRTQRDDGGFPGHNPKRCEYGPFDIGQIIRFMHQFGLGDDPRLERMCEWIEKNQTSEGGWVGVRVKCHPSEGGCRLGTVSVLQGLASSGQFSGTKIAEMGLEFLTQAMASESRYSHGISYPNPDRLDDIKLVEIYLGLGIGTKEEPLKRYLANILGLQEDDGSWSQQYRLYPRSDYPCKQMRRLFPKSGKPSKWITEKAMAVLKKASSSC